MRRCLLIGVWLTSAAFLGCVNGEDGDVSDDDDNDDADEEGAGAGECEDGEDNDGDGLLDCDDPGCADALECACDLYCQTFADKIEALDCFADWATSWPDQGFVDADDYVENCQADHQAQYEDALDISQAEATEVLAHCQVKLQAILSAKTCDDLATAPG